jgi:hypothetical protein
MFLGRSDSYLNNTISAISLFFQKKGNKECRFSKGPKGSPKESFEESLGQSLTQILT